MAKEEKIKFMESKGWGNGEDQLIFFKKNKWYGFDLAENIQMFSSRSGMNLLAYTDFKDCEGLL